MATTIRPWLTAAGLALTSLDAVVTVAAIQFLGATEANPLLANAIEAVGLHVTMLGRLALGLVAILVIDTLTRHPRNRSGLTALGLAVGALVLVNLSNGLQISSHVLASVAG